MSVFKFALGAALKTHHTHTHTLLDNSDIAASLISQTCLLFQEMSTRKLHEEHFKDKVT